MSPALHPTLPRAITIRAGTEVQLWDLTEPEARLVITASSTYRLQYPAADEGVIGCLYAAADAFDFAAPCYVGFLSWDDLQRLQTLPLPRIRIWLQCLALAPDQRAIAVGSFEEALYLIDRQTQRVTARQSGGEWISGCTFSPDSSLLASAHTFQGGGYLRIDRVRDGRLEPLHTKLDRSGLTTRIRDFADSFASLRFSPDGATLAAFETSIGAVDTDGWFGDLVLYDVRTGRPRWATSLSAAQLGEDLVETAAFDTNPVFGRDGAMLYVGTPTGTVLEMDAVTGRRQRTLTFGTTGPIYWLGLDAGHNRLWTIDAATDELRSLQL